MTMREITATVIIVLVVAVAIYDVIAYAIGGVKATISNIIQDVVPGTPAIAFFAGYLACHLFGQSNPDPTAKPSMLRSFLRRFAIKSPLPAAAVVLPPGRGIPQRGVNVADSDVIGIKAHAVMDAAHLNPNVFDIGTILGIIMSIFQGLAACKPPTPTPTPTPTPVGAPTAAQVHQAISNPGPLHRIALRRTVRKAVHNPALQQHVEQGVLTVGATSTVDETSAMFRQAVGYPPA